MIVVIIVIAFPQKMEGKNARRKCLGTEIILPSAAGRGSIRIFRCSGPAFVGVRNKCEPRFGRLPHRALFCFHKTAWPFAGRLLPRLYLDRARRVFDDVVAVAKAVVGTAADSAKIAFLASNPSIRLV